MHRFDLNETYFADCVVSEQARAGQILHVKRDNFGHAVTLTGIARYFAWKQEFIEGYNSHWRIDCFVRRHLLAADPTLIGDALVAALVREGLAAEPIWLSTHRSDDEKGKPYGKLYEEE